MEYRIPDTSSWWLDEEIPRVVLLVLAYLAFVLRIGPAFMKNRPAYKLTTTLLVYNALQVLISAYLVKICSREVLESGLLPRKCYTSIENHWKLVYIGNRFYFYAKCTELLDTVFFVLRKKDKQVSFLHLYHHSLMVLCYFVFKYDPSHVTSVLRLVNSGVHVVMYTYYSLAALGPRVAKYLRWKRYITSLQLVQFIFFIAYSIAVDLVSECPFSKGRLIFLMINLVLFSILFANFYKQSYLKKETDVNKNKVNVPCMSQMGNTKKE